MFSPMIWYNFYLISIVFRLKFLSAFHIFIICSNVSICIPYICLFIYMHIYIWNFFHCLQIVLKVSFSLVMLSSITVLGNAGWNSYFQSAFSPSWLFPAVPFISVKVSFNLSHLSTSSVSFAFLAAVQSCGCLLFAWFSFLMHMLTTGVCSFESYVCLPDLALYYCAGICHLVGSERWASWGSACLSYCSYAGCQLKCLNLSSASVFCNYIGWLWMAHLQCGGPLLIYASGRCH